MMQEKYENGSMQKAEKEWELQHKFSKIMYSTLALMKATEF
jgi:hypothetical protein